MIQRPGGLDLGRVSGETPGIELSHQPSNFGYIFCRLRIVVDHLSKLAEIAHVLLDSFWGIGRISGRIYWRGPPTATPALGIIASVDVARTEPFAPPP